MDFARRRNMTREEELALGLGTVDKLEADPEGRTRARTRWTNLRPPPAAQGRGSGVGASPYLDPSRPLVRGRIFPHPGRRRPVVCRSGSLCSSPPLQPRLIGTAPCGPRSGGGHRARKRPRLSLRLQEGSGAGLSEVRWIEAQARRVAPWDCGCGSCRSLCRPSWGSA